MEILNETKIFRKELSIDWCGALVFPQTLVTRSRRDGLNWNGWFIFDEDEWAFFTASPRILDKPTVYRLMGTSEIDRTYWEVEIFLTQGAHSTPSVLPNGCSPLTRHRPFDRKLQVQVNSVFAILYRSSSSVDRHEIFPLIKEILAYKNALRPWTSTTVESRRVDLGIDESSTTGNLSASFWDTG